MLVHHPRARRPARLDLVHRSAPAAAVLDVGPWGRAQGAGTPSDLVDLVEASPQTQERVTSLVRAAPPDGEACLPAAAVRLLAPLRAPNSLRDFLAFGDHVQRVRRQPAGQPVPADRRGSRGLSQAPPTLPP